MRENFNIKQLLLEPGENKAQVGKLSGPLVSLPCTKKSMLALSLRRLALLLPA